MHDVHTPQVGDTSMAFVNAHFAAHQNNVRERVGHFHEIQQDLLKSLLPPGYTAVPQQKVNGDCLFCAC